MKLRQTLSLVLSLAIAVNPALAATSNIIRLGAPVSMPPPPTENWVAAEPEYSDWETGAPYGCSTWTPSPAGYSESTQFVQTADDCEADASRTRQEREFDTVSESYRYVGEPVTEEVTYVNQTASRDYRIAYTNWENAGDFYGCTNWTPAPEGYPIGTSFTQTATDCSIDQTQTRAEHSRLEGFNWVSEASLSYERTLSSQTSQRQAEGTADLPTIALSAPSTAVFAGEAFVLNWSAQNSASVTLKGDVAASGLATSDFTVTGSTYEVTPAAPGTYRYTATATNSANQSITAHKDVTAVSGPTISTFTVDRAAVATGGTVTFNWTANGFDSLKIDNGIGIVSGNTKSISIDSVPGSRTYTLTATKTLNGIEKTDSKALQVEVVAEPTLSITSAPTTVFSNAAFTLGWTATGATNHKIRGNVAASGVSTTDLDLGAATSRAITPTAPGSYTYTVTATNAVGVSTTSSRTVTVVADPVISEITASPTTVTTGGNTRLSWSTTGTSLSIDQSVGTVTGSYVDTNVGVTPGSKTYTLTARSTLNGVTRSATKSVAVSVLAAPTVSISTAPSTNVFVGEAFTLGWTGSGASSYAIKGSATASGVTTTDVAKGTTTSHSITPTVAGTYTYTVTATNAAGASVTATRSVTAVPLPALTSFTASPTSVTAGGSTTLAWTGSGYTSLSIDQGVGAVTVSNSSKSVGVGTVVTTKTYTITGSATLNGITKTTSRTASVSVTAAPSYVYNSGNKAMCVTHGTGYGYVVASVLYWQGTSYQPSGATSNACYFYTGQVVSVGAGTFKIGAIKSSTSLQLEFEIMKL